MAGVDCWSFRLLSFAATAALELVRLWRFEGAADSEPAPEEERVGRVEDEEVARVDMAPMSPC